MRQERIQLDQALQVLFQISDRMTVYLINGLFDRQFDPEKVKLYREDYSVIYFPASFGARSDKKEPGIAGEKRSTYE